MLHDFFEKSYKLVQNFGIIKSGTYILTKNEITYERKERLYGKKENYITKWK